MRQILALVALALVIGLYAAAGPVLTIAFLIRVAVAVTILAVIVKGATWLLGATGVR